MWYVVVVEMPHMPFYWSGWSSNLSNMQSIFGKNGNIQLWQQNVSFTHILHSKKTPFFCQLAINIFSTTCSSIKANKKATRLSLSVIWCLLFLQDHSRPKRPKKCLNVDHWLKRSWFVVGHKEPITTPVRAKLADSLKTWLNCDNHLLLPQQQLSSDHWENTFFFDKKGCFLHEAWGLCVPMLCCVYSTLINELAASRATLKGAHVYIS